MNRFRITTRIAKCDFASEQLIVTLDEQDLWPGDKYTILERGYALYMPIQGGFTKEWIEGHAEALPKIISGIDMWGYIETDRTMLVTSHPVLVALALQSWWAKVGEVESPKLEEAALIPNFNDAVEIIRNRRILNDFNYIFAGQVPGILFHSGHD